MSDMERVDPLEPIALSDELSENESKKESTSDLVFENEPALDPTTDRVHENESSLEPTPCRLPENETSIEPKSGRLFENEPFSGQHDKVPDLLRTELTPIPAGKKAQELENEPVRELLDEMIDLFENGPLRELLDEPVIEQTDEKAPKVKNELSPETTDEVAYIHQNKPFIVRMGEEAQELKTEPSLEPNDEVVDLLESGLVIESTDEVPDLHGIEPLEVLFENVSGQFQFEIVLESTDEVSDQQGSDAPEISIHDLARLFRNRLVIEPTDEVRDRYGIEAGEISIGDMTRIFGNSLVVEPTDEVLHLLGIEAAEVTIDDVARLLESNSFPQELFNMLLNDVEANFHRTHTRYSVFMEKFRKCIADTLALIKYANNVFYGNFWSMCRKKNVQLWLRDLCIIRKTRRQVLLEIKNIERTMKKCVYTRRDLSELSLRVRLPGSYFDRRFQLAKLLRNNLKEVDGAISRIKSKCIFICRRSIDMSRTTWIRKFICARHWKVVYAHH